MSIRFLFYEKPRESVHGGICRGPVDPGDYSGGRMAKSQVGRELGLLPRLGSQPCCGEWIRGYIRKWTRTSQRDAHAWLSAAAGRVDEAEWRPIGVVPVRELRARCHYLCTYRGTGLPLGVVECCDNRGTIGGD